MSLFAHEPLEIGQQNVAELGLLEPGEIEADA